VAASGRPSYAPTGFAPLFEPEAMALEALRDRDSTMVLTHSSSSNTTSNLGGRGVPIERGGDAPPLLEHLGGAGEPVLGLAAQGAGHEHVEEVVREDARHGREHGARWPRTWAW